MQKAKIKMENYGAPQSGANLWSVKCAKRISLRNFALCFFNFAL
jgi:hypothetical protein